MMVDKKADMTAEEATAHWNRVQAIYRQAMSSTLTAGEMLLFSAVDVGSEGYWWDYGR
jgi:hypothetical protein